MYIPTRSEFCEMTKQGNLVPVYRELNVDLESPVSVYLKLRGRGASFLLESVEGGEHLGRYSFIGVDPTLIVFVRRGQVTLESQHEIEHDLRPDQSKATSESDDPLVALRAILRRYRAVRVPGLPRFFGGAVGYMGYDMVRHFERLRTYPAVPPKAESPDGADDKGYVDPDATFMIAETVVAFDHVRHRALIIANAAIAGDPEAAYDAALARIENLARRLEKPLASVETGFFPDGHALQSNFTAREFQARVRRAQEHIAAGDIYQVVLSQRFQRETAAAPFSIYRALRRLNPSPYMFFLDLRDRQLIGSSPEMLVRLEDRMALLNPIAGTRRRGATEAEDAQLEGELRADPKERAEHVMLVDLGRNDLGRVCEYGSVRVSDFMTVERYSHVMHLVSRIHGQLRRELDAFDLLRATFPAGTVSGAPKVRAMEIIDELEGTPRGPYAGAVGYLNFPTADSQGNMDLCITIRTIVMRGREAIIQAGAGIVADSNPAQEYQECVNKAAALAEAIRMAEGMGK